MTGGEDPTAAVEGTATTPAWRNLAAAVFVVAMGLSATRPQGVPILNLVNLGFHELGHLLFIWAPSLVQAAMGSITQVFVPLGLAGYFALVRRDEIGTGVCLGWAGTSATEWATYVADAPYERLQLIGGDHDWAFILFELDQLHRAATFATTIRVFAVLLVLIAIAWCARPWWPRVPIPRRASRVARPKRWVL